MRRVQNELGNSTGRIQADHGGLEFSPDRRMRSRIEIDPNAVSGRPQNELRDFEAIGQLDSVHLEERRGLHGHRSGRARRYLNRRVLIRQANVTGLEGVVWMDRGGRLACRDDADQVDLALRIEIDRTDLKARQEVLGRSRRMSERQTRCGGPRPERSNAELGRELHR